MYNSKNGWELWNKSHSTIVGTMYQYSATYKIKTYDVLVQLGPLVNKWTNLVH